jgi:hypothetical protein
MLAETPFAGRHIAPCGHIILIPSDPVFCFYPWILRAYRRSNKYQFYSLWIDTTLARTLTFYHSWGEHASHYTTDTVRYLTTSIILKYYSFLVVILSTSVKIELAFVVLSKCLSDYAYRCIGSIRSSLTYV